MRGVAASTSLYGTTRVRKGKFTFAFRNSPPVNYRNTKPSLAMYCSFTDIGPDMKSAVHTHFSTDYACFASNVKTTLTEIYWHNKMNNTDITNPSLGLVIRRDAFSDKHSLIIYTKTKQNKNNNRQRQEHVNMSRQASEPAHPVSKPTELPAVHTLQHAVLLLKA